MSSLKSNLRADERLVYEARIHWFFYVAPVMIFFLGLLMSPSKHDAMGQFLGYIFLLAGAVAFVVRFLDATSTEIIVTNRKAAFRKGIFSKISCDLLLDKCDTINIEEPFWGRIFGYGTLLVTTNGVNGHRFRYVKSPRELMVVIHNQLEK